MADKEGAHIYVLIAIDEDYRVRENIVVSDLEQAEKIFSKLREIWGGEKVCMAGRQVDRIPENIIKAMQPKKEKPALREAGVKGARWA